MCLTWIIILIFIIYILYIIYGEKLKHKNVPFDLLDKFMNFETFNVCQKCGSYNLEYGPFLYDNKEYFYYCYGCRSFVNNTYYVVIKYDKKTCKTYIIKINKYKLKTPIEINNENELLKLIEDFLNNGEII